MSFNVCIIPIIALSSPTLLVMVGSWITHICCVECCALELTSWIDVFFFQSHLIANTRDCSRAEHWGQNQRGLWHVTLRLALPGSWLHYVASWSADIQLPVQHVWVRCEERQWPLLPNRKQLYQVWRSYWSLGVSAQGIPSYCYYDKAIVCERLSI